MASLIGSSDAFTGFSSSRPAAPPATNVDSWSSGTGAVQPPQVVDEIQNSAGEKYLTENDLDDIKAITDRFILSSNLLLLNSDLEFDSFLQARTFISKLLVQKYGDSTYIDVSEKLHILQDLVSVEHTGSTGRYRATFHHPEYLFKVDSSGTFEIEGDLRIPVNGSPQNVAALLSSLQDSVDADVVVPRTSNTTHRFTFEHPEVRVDGKLLVESGITGMPIDLRDTVQDFSIKFTNLDSKTSRLTSDGVSYSGGVDSSYPIITTQDVHARYVVAHLHRSDEIHHADHDTSNIWSDGLNVRFNRCMSTALGVAAYGGFCDSLQLPKTWVDSTGGGLNQIIVSKQDKLRLILKRANFDDPSQPFSTETEGYNDQSYAEVVTKTKDGYVNDESLQIVGKTVTTTAEIIAGTDFYLQNPTAGRAASLGECLSVTQIHDYVNSQLLGHTNITLNGHDATLQSMIGTAVSAVNNIASSALAQVQQIAQETLVQVNNGKVQGGGYVTFSDGDVLTQASPAPVCYLNSSGKLTSAYLFSSTFSDQQFGTPDDAKPSRYSAGLVPSSDGSTSTFLRADGQWVNPIAQVEYDTAVNTGSIAGQKASIETIEYELSELSAQKNQFAGEVSITPDSSGDLIGLGSRYKIKTKQNVAGFDEILIKHHLEDDGITLSGDDIECRNVFIKSKNPDSPYTHFQAVSFEDLPYLANLTRTISSNAVAENSLAVFSDRAIVKSSPAPLCYIDSDGRISSARLYDDEFNDQQFGAVDPDGDKPNQFAAGLVPASNGETDRFLRADGTWQTISQPDISDGVTVTNRSNYLFKIEVDGGGGSQPQTGVSFQTNDGHPVNPTSSQATYVASQLVSGWESGEDAWKDAYLKFRLHASSSPLTTTMLMKQNTVFINPPDDKVAASCALEVNGDVKCSGKFLGDGSELTGLPRFDSITAANRLCITSLVDGGTISSAPATTSLLSEGSNLFFTNDRCDARVNARLAQQLPAITADALTAQTITANSDRNLKQDITVLDNRWATTALNDIQPSSYAFKTDPNRLRYGVVAQDVQAVMPELVHENAEHSLSVDYMGLVPLLLASLKDAHSRISRLENVLAHSTIVME